MTLFKKTKSIIIKIDDFREEKLAMLKNLKQKLQHPKASIKYYGFIKWVAMLNDPFGIVDLLSGGAAQLTQAGERLKYENFIDKKTEKY